MMLISHWIHVANASKQPIKHILLEFPSLKIPFLEMGENRMINVYKPCFIKKVVHTMNELP